MIKINLLGNETVRDNTGKFIVGGFAASLVLLLAIFFGAYSILDSSVTELREQETQLKAQLETLQKTTSEVKDLESKEKEYNEKLIVIAKLKRNKIGPVRVLDDLNKAMPERAWVTGVKESAGLMRIEGKALDNPTIAVFMKDLDVSNFFDSVDLFETKQVEERGVKIKEFVLNASVSYTGLPKPKEGEGDKDPGPSAANINRTKSVS
jgi:type IV pilus assembly protein PilN